jgi:hypothetical protein
LRPEPLRFPEGAFGTFLRYPPALEPWLAYQQKEKMPTVDGNKIVNLTFSQ